MIGKSIAVIPNVYLNISDKYSREDFSVCHFK